MTEPNNNELNIGREELYLIRERLTILSEKLDRNNEKLDTETSKKAKSWWTIIVEILGIPAIVVAILLQINQLTVTKGTQEKTSAETEKLKIDSLKTRVELEGLLNDLAEKKQTGVAAYRKQIEETLPKIEATLYKLRSIEQKNHQSTLQRLVVVFVAMWVVFTGLGLFFEMLNHIWSTLLTLLSNTIYSLDSYESDKPRNPKQYKRIHRMQRLFLWMHSLLSPVPSILHWSIRVSIFIAILVPFFDQICNLSGSNDTFNSIAKAASHGEIATAIARIKNILLFGGI